MIQRRYRCRSKQLSLKMRVTLSKLPEGAAASACDDGLDSIAGFVTRHLGAHVWSRAVYNASEDWDETQMIEAMRRALGEPARATEMWMLAQVRHHLSSIRPVLT